MASSKLFVPVMGASVVAGAACVLERALRVQENARERHVVVVGGGVMGHAVALSLLESPRRLRVTVVDEHHAVRGSWGESRASHLSMDDATSSPRRRRFDGLQYFPGKPDAPRNFRRRLV